jgi:hypothetical protein
MRRFLILGLLIIASQARAEEAPGCYSQHKQLDREVVLDLSQPFSWESYLPSRGNGGAFLTTARVQLSSTESGNDWDATLRLDFVNDGHISLAYNFYGIAVSVPGLDANYTYFFDLTANCTQAGLGLFPSNDNYYQLPSFKLPRLPNDEGLRALRIQVWGKL